MAWNTVHKVNSRTRIGLETTFGTTATTMKDLVLDRPTLPLGKATRKVIENLDQRRYRRRVTKPVKGLLAESPLEFPVQMKRLVTRLNAAATPVACTHANALSHQILLRLWMGTELTPAAGSLVVSSAGGPPINAVTVTAAQGARFVAGQMVGIETNHTTVIEWRRVIDVTGDVLTVYPGLNGTPVNTTGVVLNAYNYHATSLTDTTSFTLEHAMVESATTETQQRAKGCYGQVTCEFTVGDVPRYKMAGMSTTHSDPGDISLSLIATADDEGAPLVWDPIIYLTSSSAAPSLATVDSLTLTVPRKYQRLVGPGVQGTAGVAEVASDEVSVTLKGWVATSEWTAFLADTSQHLIAYCSDGSTTSYRAAGFCCPNMVRREYPQHEEVGDLVYFTAKYQCQQDTSITALPTPASTEAPTIAPVIFWRG